MGTEPDRYQTLLYEATRDVYAEESRMGAQRRNGIPARPSKRSPPRVTDEDLAKDNAAWQLVWMSREGTAYHKAEVEKGNKPRLPTKYSGLYYVPTGSSPRLGSVRLSSGEYLAFASHGKLPAHVSSSEDASNASVTEDGPGVEENSMEENSMEDDSVEDASVTEDGTSMSDAGMEDAGDDKEAVKLKRRSHRIPVPSKRKSPDDEDFDDTVTPSPKSRKSVSVKNEKQPATATKTKAKCTRTGAATANKPRMAATVFAENIKEFLKGLAPEKDSLHGLAGALMPASAREGPRANLPALDERHQDFANITVRASARENVGDAADLHPSEVRVCELFGWTAHTYRSQKARAFIGLALFVEYNERLRLEYEEAASKPSSSAAIQPKPPRLASFRKTNMQQACNADVNTVSKLHTVFVQFGWFAGMGGEMDEAVHARVTKLFPGKYRASWAGKMKDWELGQDKDTKLRLKIPFLLSVCSDWSFDDDDDLMEA